MEIVNWLKVISDFSPDRPFTSVLKIWRTKPLHDTTTRLIYFHTKSTLRKSVYGQRYQPHTYLLSISMETGFSGFFFLTTEIKKNQSASRYTMVYNPTEIVI